MQTILLLARRTPLPADLSLEKLVGELPPTPFRTAQEVVVDGFDQDVSVVLAGEAEGKEGVEEAGIEDPFWEMIGRLRPHFETIRSVRFAQKED